MNLDIKEIKNVSLICIEEGWLYMILTVKETADFLRVSEKQVYKLISNNKIPYIKLGGKILVDKNSLIDHLHKIEVKEA